jgi:hypothetical protein
MADEISKKFETLPVAGLLAVALGAAAFGAIAIGAIAI